MSTSAPGPQSFDRIFVGGVPRGTTGPQLRAALALAGVEVGGIDFVMDRATGLQRGFAFVALRARIDVLVDAHQLALLRSATVEGCVLDVRGIPDRRPS